MTEDGEPPAGDKGDPYPPSSAQPGRPPGSPPSSPSSLTPTSPEARFAAEESDFKGANDEAVVMRVAALEEEHRDLDAAIRALEASAPYERLVIARLKKKKLALKDEIQTLKDTMLPDIIA